MQKETIIKHIEKARKAHLTQLQKVQFLVKGMPLDVEPTTVSKYKCVFGSWLYSDEEFIKKALGASLFTEVEALHSQWHEEYQKIYQIYYVDSGKGLLSKLLGKKGKVPALEQDKAQTYLTGIEQTTEALIRKIDVMKRRINSLSPSHFDDVEE
jgi:hypothetical protein